MAEHIIATFMIEQRSRFGSVRLLGRKIEASEKCRRKKQLGLT